ncbi:MAG: WYL domain-containing protein [Acidimicrobiia bacterium]|nr:WYL domain-containing protein [Acidimicrobiia bacterium]RZV47860.1 MAG: WYL domain-containing protein [Acidimicrobiia bacterium]
MTSAKTAKRLTRILSMLPYVIANPGVSVDDLSERFGYRRKELIDDLNLVFLTGLPGYGPGDLIDASVEDDEVYVDTADYFARPLRLTPPEALALLASGMALTSAGQGPPALESAISKLSSVVAPEAEGGLVVDLKEPEFVGLLRSAVEGNRVVSLTYTALGSGQTTERSVEPWSVFSANGNWYLSAFCRTADAERVFRVDRIRAAAATDEGFVAPAEAPPPEVRYTPGEEDVRTVIGLGPAAHWVAAYYPVEDLGDGKIRFSSSDPAVAARLLLRLGDDAKLVEGDEVAGLLADYRQRIRARYAGD